MFPILVGQPGRFTDTMAIADSIVLAVGKAFTDSVAVADSIDTAHVVATPTPGDNTVNACSPHMPDTMYVTLAGLAGDFAAYNVKTQVDYVSDTSWYDGAGPSTPYLRLWYNDAVGQKRWQVGVVISVNCSITFAGPTSTPNTCVPWDDTYTQLACSFLTCSDPNSCADSASATCVVSWS